MLKNLWQKLYHYLCFETRCLEDATILKNFIENNQVHDFLVGLNVEFDQVKVQILNKKLSTLNETISIIRVEESKKSVMLEPQNLEGLAIVANKESD